MLSSNDPTYSPKAENEWMNVFHWKHIMIKVRFPNKLIMFTFDVILPLSLTKVWTICFNNSERNPEGIHIYTQVGF